MLKKFQTTVNTVLFTCQKQENGKKELTFLVEGNQGF